MPYAESAAEFGAAHMHNDTAHNGSLMRHGKAPAGSLTAAGPSATGITSQTLLHNRCHTHL